ncbi:MAG: HEAT repeat domain-containing protein [Planctomycetota bacterium]|nr:HEAT repeat domain-containing protein [Planctomycetota bacterium]
MPELNTCEFILELASATYSKNLSEFRKQVLSTLRTVLGCDSILLAHPDPEDPEKRLDTVCTQDRVFKTTRSPKRSGLAGLFMKQTTPSKIQLSGADPKILQECQRVFQAEPTTLHSHPLVPPNSDTPESVLVFSDPTNPTEVQIFEKLDPSILANPLHSHLDEQSVRKKTRHLDEMLTLSRRLIGKHPTIASLRQTILDPNPEPLPLFLTGEPGTGKKHTANVLHAHSQEADRLFVEINCHDYESAPLRSLLFEDGFEGGAPLVEQNIFLHLSNIETLTEEHQSLLLQHLDGSTASSRASMLFSMSCVDTPPPSTPLISRLSIRQVHLPSLDERGEDFYHLATHFLREANITLRRRVQGFTHSALATLKHQEWPRNLTSLRSMINRLVRLSSEGLIDTPHLEQVLPAKDREEDHTTSQGLSGEHLPDLLRSSQLRNWKRAIQSLKDDFDPIAIPSLFERLQDPQPVMRIDAVTLLSTHGDPQTRSRVLGRMESEENPDVLRECISNLGTSQATENASQILTFLSHEEPSVRATAVVALMDLEFEANEALGDLTEDPSFRVRTRALAALGRFGNREAEKKLLSMLQSPLEEERIEVVRALDHCPRDIGYLLRLLESESSIDVQIAAVRSLGRLENPQAVRPLVSRLQDPHLKFFCADALGKLGAPEAIPPLLDLIERETNSLIRRTAIIALGKIGPPLQIESLLRYLEVPNLAPAVVEVLCSLGGQNAEKTLIDMIDPDHPLCIEAVKGIEKVGTERSAESLVNLLGNIPDYLARHVSNALSSIPESVHLLIEALENPDKRTWAVVTLGILGDPLAVPPLMRHRHHSRNVEQAIKRIGLPAVDPLLRLLPEHEDFIMDFTLQAGGSALPSLLQLLEEKRHSNFVEEALVGLGNQTVSPLLDQLEGASSPDTRTLILSVLARIGDRRSFPPILKDLSSAPPHQRHELIDSLSQADHPALLQPLIDILEEEDPISRIISLRGLQEHRPAHAFDTILENLQHPSPRIRIAALITASRYGGESARQAFSVALADRSPLVLQTATKLALQQEILTRDLIRKRATDSELDIENRISWIRILGSLPEPESLTTLLSMLASDSPERILSTIRKILIQHRSRAIPHLWPFLESSNPKRIDLGQQILKDLDFDPKMLPDLIKSYRSGSEARRRSIEIHLAASPKLARQELLRVRQRGSDTTILKLLEILSKGTTPS